MPEYNENGNIIKAGTVTMKVQPKRRKRSRKIIHVEKGIKLQSEIISKIKFR